ncbi:hypothetical protein L6452_28139 [Arctium lappa]|uniref:Uncharacterized protein n=1 Tax=Arctium lappa TaxID=4217 RepID=A0ACB8ZYM0_ARCLA|nr:hypothetical protein L6452_28139 [Arctium lappa]
MVVVEEEEFLISENQELERNVDEGLEMTPVTTMMVAEFSQIPKTCGKVELIMKVYESNEQEKEVMKEVDEFGEEEKDKEETIEKDDAELVSLDFLGIIACLVSFDSLGFIACLALIFDFLGIIACSDRRTSHLRALCLRFKQNLTLPTERSLRDEL